MRARIALAIAAGLALALGTCPGVAEGDGPEDRRAPSIGYVHPAGGRRGTTIAVLSGGQNLVGVVAAHVSGDGVRATVVRYVRPLNVQQQQELRRRIAEVREKRRAAAADAANPRRRRKEPEPRTAAAKPPDEDRVDLPEHPLLDSLDKLSDEALDAVARRFLTRASPQQNPQLAETVEIDVEIAADAAPGVREMRLETNTAVTNPLRFYVGNLPEMREEETSRRTNAPATVLDVPFVANGQVLPGDADRFRFRARRSQRLVIRAHARDLVPYLADAVPGWFQAVLSLSDARGREVAFADDSGFDPDPQLAYDVPADGEYVLEVRDALWRGREDFVYRVSVEEDPLLPFTPSPADRETTLRAPAAVDLLPACDETEPNDEPARAQRIAFPQVVRGRIAQPGDVDCYRFEGRAGDEVVAEIEGRRLRSPIDSLLRLVDARGNVVAWNDDFDDGEPGTLTHHADSYLRAKLTADGPYVVRVADAQAHGGLDHTYRLRVAPPRGDFQVVVTPAGLSVAPGRNVPFTVHVLRRDGFSDPVDVVLADPPPGFVLSGARIAAGRRSARMTLTAPPDAAAGAVPLRIEGRARVGGEDVSRAASPAEDVMQAFAYRHLSVAQDWVVVVRGARRAGAAADVAGRLPVRIAPGGDARVEVRIPGVRPGLQVRPELDEPPAGLSLVAHEVVPGGLVLVLRADAAAVKPGDADNVIVEVVAEGDARAPRARRFSLGYLPAIPFEITAK